MKRTPKCYNEEEFELDNIYNDDDDRYGKRDSLLCFID